MHDVQEEMLVENRRRGACLLAGATIILIGLSLAFGRIGCGVALGIIGLCLICMAAE